MMITDDVASSLVITENDHVDKQILLNFEIFETVQKGRIEIQRLAYNNQSTTITRRIGLASRYVLLCNVLSTLDDEFVCDSSHHSQCY